MPFADSIQTTLRSTRRYAEVLNILIRYGFGSFVQETGLDRMIEKGKVMLGAAPSDEATTRLPVEMRVRLALEELGPTFIKLGQILSTRPDLIPASFCDEFRKLQSECAHVPFEKIRTRLDEEFEGKTDDILTSVEETPLAAASMAQAHRAVLRDGTPVVLKVTRPDIERIVEADMAVMREIAEFLERRMAHHGISPKAVVGEFSRQLERELDLEHEGRATDRLRAFFEDDPDIHFTKVYWEATTRNVLALEEVHGVLLSRLNPAELPPDTRRKLVENGTDAVFRMCLEFGFFHADPHPGNIFALADGKVCFVDCGMTGHVDMQTRRSLAGLVSGVLAGDLDRVVRLALELTDADPALEDDRALRAEAWELIAKFQSSQSLKGMDLSELLNGLFTLFRRHKVQCPADLVYLIKALTTVQGVGLEIDPDFDIITHVKPHIRRLLTQQHGFRALRERMMKALQGYIELVEETPSELRSIIATMRRRDFSIRLHHDGLDNLTAAIERASRYVAFSLILSSAIIGSSVMIHAYRKPDDWGLFSTIGILILIIAGFFSITLLYGMYRKR
jgi:ubiquinone biosynthesis protein